jgi:hypothetical protein
VSDAEEARQDAEQFDCAVAGEVADLEGRSELSMPGCQANASKVIEAILTIAREEAVDGKLDLERLEALASAVRSKEVRSFYSANYKHCQSANNLTPFTPYREMFLGRVISSPLEALLFATPPVMLRSQLPALFAAVKAMIGDQVFDRLDDTARVVYEEYISKMGRDFVWDPFYADPRIVAIFCETVVRLAEPFAVYEQTRDRFIEIMNTPVGEADGGSAGESTEVFTVQHFHGLFLALFRPVTPKCAGLPHRDGLAGTGIPGAVDDIDALLDELAADR